jgi:hypothetical protein
MANDPISAAARVIYAAGNHHRWWGGKAKPYDDLDSIARSEFEGIVQQALHAADIARAERQPDPHPTSAADDCLSFPVGAVAQSVRRYAREILPTEFRMLVIMAREINGGLAVACSGDIARVNAPAVLRECANRIESGESPEGSFPLAT